MAFEEMNDKRKEEIWFLDSGCSNHMCGEKSAFSEMDDTFRHVVKLGNNSKMEVFEKGKVKLNLNGIVYVIKEVYYIPNVIPEIFFKANS